MAEDRHRWLVLVAMTGSLSMILLDQTVVSVALPSMGRELPLSPTGQQWVVNAYVLAMAAGVALGGKVGDRLGGVTTFRLGVTVFFLASMACGLAPHGDLGEPSVIAARALQGVGAALMTPVSAAIVINAFDVRSRGRAMAIYAGISQVFLAVGPLLGGVLTETLSWRAVFWLNLPVGLAALVLVRIAAPDNVRAEPARIEAGSVVLLVGGMSLLVLAIQQASTWSWGSPVTLGTMAVGAVALAAFTVRQLRSTDPLVDVRLFARQPFLANLVVLGLVQFGLLAVVLYGSLYQQDLLHQSPVQAGFAVLPLILALAIASQVGGRWYDRSGVRPPTLAGLTVATAGLVVWAISLPHLSYVDQIPGMLLTGLGIGLLMSPTNTDALGRVSAGQRSQGSALVQTVRQLGGTLGVAIIGTVILGIEHRGTSSSDAVKAAGAVSVGFVCAAAVFALALVLAWRLLSPVPVEADREPGDVALPG